MKSLLIALALGASPSLCLAWDADHLRQLRASKICTDCDLSEANLRWANVYAAELGGADNLVDSDMSGSNLSRADLYGANLEGARLRDVNLTGADMSWVSLIAADLTGATLDDTRLQGAIFCRTTMPDGAQNDVNC